MKQPVSSRTESATLGLEEGHVASRSAYPFDPDHGETVRAPQEGARGYWVGAPSVRVDGDATYLSYRHRRPRGQGRGHTTCLAVSDDGRSFRDIWSVRREELGSSSIERCAVVQGGDGWLLYLSYVDPTDRRWCIDVVTAGKPEQLREVDRRRPVLRAAELGLEAVKDPVVVFRGGLYWMYVSCAALGRGNEHLDQDQLHGDEDVFVTGAVTSQTGLAVSRDGLHYEWLGLLLHGNAGQWDAYATRLTSILSVDGLDIGFYDGSATVSENYEERTGVVVAHGPCRLVRLSVSGPWLESPHGSRSLRYLDHAEIGGKTLFYYEWARPDGAHELRLSEVETATITSRRYAELSA